MAAVITLSVVCVALSLLPRAFGDKCFGMGTDTMDPTIKKGSLLIVSPIKFENISVGDIITFKSDKEEGYFTHRVIDIFQDKKQFATKGDAESKPDPYTVGYECVMGRVQRVIPFVGYPSIWLSTMTGKAVVIVFYIVWISIETELYESRKRRANKK